MSRITIEQLGVELKRKRDKRGLRETAGEIGISTATLSRIESGKQPDLETFSKLCKWLGIDAGELLGCSLKPNETAEKPPVSSTQGGSSVVAPRPGVVHAHFRAHKEMSAETVQHLSALIVAVQEFVLAEGHRPASEIDEL